jgi:hypothetical protein
MILYELRCATGHGFDAWFRNADTYDQQHAAHQITCPICGDGDVSKAPMAPRIGRSSKSTQETLAPAAQNTAEPGRQIAPEQLRMVMSKIAELNKHIAETSDYVGKAFAEEARKIHYGETEHREIYGEASPQEAAELRDEGIAVAAIPWIRRTDS